MTIRTVLAWAIICAWAGELRAQGDADMASRATAAWKKRQEAVQTASVEFKLRRTVVKGLYSDILPDPGREVVKASKPGTKAAATVPPEDTTLESVNRYVIDGAKVRFENNHPIWGPSGKPGPQQCVATSDGTLGKIWRKDLDGDGRIRSIIDDTVYTPEHSNSMLTPLSVTLRGFDSPLSFYAIRDMKPAGVTMPVNGDPCVLFEKVTRSSTTSFWLDPARDFVARRITKTMDGKVVEQSDINYRPEAACGFAPRSWSYTHYTRTGQRMIWHTAEVIGSRFNESYPPETFAIEFPPGTYVTDNRTRAYYRIQPDGSHRDVDRRTGRELPETATSLARKHSWLVVSLAAFIAIWLALTFFKRRGRGP